MRKGLFVGGLVLLMVLALVGAAMGQEISLRLNTGVHFSGSGAVTESVNVHDSIMMASVTTGNNMQYDYWNTIGFQMDSSTLSATYNKNIHVVGDVVSFSVITNIDEVYRQMIGVGEAEGAEMYYEEYEYMDASSKDGKAGLMRNFVLEANYIPADGGLLVGEYLVVPEFETGIEHIFTADAGMYGVYFQSYIGCNGNVSSVGVYDKVYLDIPATPVPDTGYNFDGTLNDYWAINNDAIKVVNITGQFNGPDNDVPGGKPFYFTDLSLQLQ